jgi:hypothetical protein
MGKNHFAALRDLLRCAAPTKATALDGLLESLEITIEIDGESDEIKFQACPHRNTIRIGRKCIDRLQAHAQAAAVIYLAFAADGFEKMTLAQRHRLLKPADDLLTYSVANDLSIWLTSLTRGRPDPAIILPRYPDRRPESLSDSQRSLGNIFFQFSVAFILLHELAHLSLNHRVGRDAIEQEYEADAFAAAWLLEGVSTSSDNEAPDRISLLVGIALALLWLTIQEVFLGPQQSHSHPPSFARLMRVLDKHVDAQNQAEWTVIWDFVGTLLFFHVCAAGISVENAHFPKNLRDRVASLVEMISQRTPLKAVL